MAKAKAGKNSEYVNQGVTAQSSKERISQNALTLGLFARKWISSEEKTLYEQIHSELVREYNPQGPTECLLIERLTISMSKLRRLIEVEDAQYLATRGEVELQNQVPKSPSQQLTDPNSDQEKELAIAAKLPPLETLNAINRQQNSLNRQISKQLSELLIFKKIRLDYEQNRKDDNIAPNTAIPKESLSGLPVMKLEKPNIPEIYHDLPDEEL